MFSATESDKWHHLMRATIDEQQETNIGYGYHSYPSENCVNCVNSCSSSQYWSGCISWDNELDDCNHGCALSRSACKDSSCVNCLGLRLKSMVQLGRNQDNVRWD